MRISKFLVFTLLAVSVISYGANSNGNLAFADSHDKLPVSVSAELPLYSNGDRVVLTGQIKDYDASDGQGLTFVVAAPDNARVVIGQHVPNSDGSFEVVFTAGGPLWKLNGEYAIEFHYGSNSASTTITYNGGADPVVIPPEDNTVDTPPDDPPIDTPPDDIIPPPPPPPPIVPPVDVDIIEPTAKPDVKPTDPVCGPGTEAVDGICQVIEPTNGCLIATATYGTELAPQVQLLREIRDNTLMSTTSGTTFMTGFNQMYYSFSPTIADMERENPLFRQAVHAFITPMISTLSIMTLADSGSESEVLGLGISVITLNLGMYIAAPAFIGFKIHKHIKSRV